MTTHNALAVAAEDTAFGSESGLPVGLTFGSASLPANPPARRLKGETRGTNTSSGTPTKSPHAGAGGAGVQRAHAPVGKRQLARLREQLSERDHAVLRRIAEHRYLTSGHLQALCFTGHGSNDAAATTTRRVLRRLETQQLIRRLTRRVGGVRAGSSATVWQLAPAGARIVREAGEGYRTHEPSPRFLNHCLAVADVHVQVRALVSNKGATNRNEPMGDDMVVSVAVQVEPLSWRSYLGLAGGRRTLQPDLYAELVTADYEDRWFIEVDCGTESMNTLLKKCQQYEDYRRSGSEQTTHGVFPRVLWIMGGERGKERAERLHRAIRRSHELTPALYEICTPEGVVAALRGSDIDDQGYMESSV